MRFIGISMICYLVKIKYIMINKINVNQLDEKKNEEDGTQREIVCVRR